jgi:tRNA (guanine-N7-)-methyltransferase
MNQSRRNPTLLQANSRQVTSNQSHLHPRLTAVLGRHLATTFRKPAAAHNRAAFSRLMAQLSTAPRPQVLDSFCGTGHSTATLARRHPDHLVVGIDKSAERLGKHPVRGTDNYMLLQAGCEDIWQLLLQEGLAVDYHYLLYPNPWPKARHLQRRIHGHASFAWLMQLGGDIELRSNWQVYVEEFGCCAHVAGRRGRVARVPEGPALTLFEQKYRHSGHELWAFTANACRDQAGVIG